jgi:general secretion pathway protein D
MAQQSTSRLALALCLGAALAGCATSAGLRAGQRAELLQDYDQAIVEYTKVLRQRPDDREARLGLDRAKLRSSQEHFSRGRRFNAGGRLDEAVVELQIANELNPANGEIADELRSVRTQLRNKVAVAREGQTALESVVERSRSLPPTGRELPADVRLPAGLTFFNAPVRDVYVTLAKLSNLTIVFDPQFRGDQPVTTDMRNMALADALQSLSTATRNFYRVTAPRTITVVPDTPAKRTEYEEEIVGIFPLSNADLRETMDLLRIVVDARRVAPVAANNTITIKDTPDRVAAAGRLIAAVDKARPEVVIDTELLEIDRTKLREYGLQLASTGSPGINGAVSVNDELTVRDLRNLTQSDVFLTSLPGLFYRLVKQDSSTRTLANLQLRTSEGLPAQARFGERVPVPVTTFSPFATGGIAQQPITSFNYENIGVNIDITPRTHHDDEVSLALKIEISSISGTGFGGLPTFGNRAINTVIRLHDGETNLLAGLIRDDERRVLSGVPGLSDLPLVGRLFAHTRKETQETDIVLTLTPRIMRVLDLSEDDLRPFRVGRETVGGGGVVELPLPPGPADPAQQPRPVQPPPATQPAPPPPGAGGTAPIFPPTAPAPPPPGK